jgi:hypothetical protein
MKNAFGVKAIASFFNLPFLYLQRQAVLAELRKNDGETKAVMEELRTLREELTYETYLKQLQDKKAALKLPRPAQETTTEQKPAPVTAAAEAKPMPKQPEEVAKATTPTQPVEVPQKPEVAAG